MAALVRLAGVVAALALAGCASGEPGDGQMSPPPASPTATATVSPAQSPPATPDACQSFGATDDVSSADPDAMSALVGASMRLGQHDCYERFVFEMTGTGEQPGWTVGYRDPLTQDGSGEPVDLRGSHELEIIVRVWTVSDFEGRPAEWPPFTGPDDIVTTGHTAILEARNMYAFEGVTQIGLGIDQLRPFRVSWLDDPPRLVVDVASGHV